MSDALQRNKVKMLWLYQEALEEISKALELDKSSHAYNKVREEILQKLQGK